MITVHANDAHNGIGCAKQRISACMVLLSKNAIHKKYLLLAVVTLALFPMGN